MIELKEFVRVATKHLAPCARLLVGCRHHIGRNLSGKFLVRLRRKIAQAADDSRLIFHLHHQYRVVGSVEGLQVTHQGHECRLISLKRRAATR